MLAEISDCQYELAQKCHELRLRMPHLADLSPLKKKKNETVDICPDMLSVEIPTYFI